jgi:hypothetical protein
MKHNAKHKYIALLAALSMSAIAQNVYEEHASYFQIKPQFDSAYGFREGLAEVRIGGYQNAKYGFIDTKGRLVINPIYDSTSWFSEGLAAVRIGDEKTGKWGYINKQGDVVIPLRFVQGLWRLSPVGDFSEGLASFRVGEGENSKAGYLDKTGKVVIPAQFYWAYRFHEGLAAVKVGGDQYGKWGYINKSGRFVINPIYENAGDFSQGLAPVNKGTEKAPDWSYINAAGKEILKIDDENAKTFRWGGASSFSEGFAKIRFDNLTDNSIAWLVINIKGEIFDVEDSYPGSRFSEGMIAAKKEGLYGYKDKKNNWVIAPRFEYADEFKNGVAKVSIGKLGAGNFGYINKAGAFVIPPVFDNDLMQGNFNEGLAPVCYKTGRFDNLCGYLKLPANTGNFK